MIEGWRWPKLDSRKGSKAFSFDSKVEEDVWIQRTFSSGIMAQVEEESSGQ